MPSKAWRRLSSGTDIKSNPPGLLDLTNLQKEANKIYGFSAEDTLNIAQKLYETHKVLSYPRTDYKCLPNEMKKEVKKILGTLKNAGLKLLNVT